MLFPSMLRSELLGNVLALCATVEDRNLRYLKLNNSNRYDGYHLIRPYHV